MVPVTSMVLLSQPVLDAYGNSSPDNFKHRVQLSPLVNFGLAVFPIYRI